MEILILGVLVMEIKERLLIAFKDEVNRLIDLENNNKLSERALNDSFNSMLDYMDEVYTSKDIAHDFSLDLYDIRNLINILEHHQPIIVCYMKAIEYLED